MIQDQNTQTNLPNNNSTEEVSEQELHTITGGCRDCKILGNAVFGQVQHAAAETAKTGCGQCAMGWARRAEDLSDLHKKIEPTINNLAGRGQCSSFGENKDAFQKIVGKSHNH